MVTTAQGGYAVVRIGAGDRDSANLAVCTVLLIPRSRDVPDRFFELCFALNPSAHGDLAEPAITVAKEHRRDWIADRPWCPVAGSGGALRIALEAEAAAAQPSRRGESIPQGEPGQGRPPRRLLPNGL